VNGIAIEEGAIDGIEVLERIRRQHLDVIVLQVQVVQIQLGAGLDLVGLVTAQRPDHIVGNVQGAQAFQGTQGVIGNLREDVVREQKTRQSRHSIDKHVRVDLEQVVPTQVEGLEDQEAGEAVRHQLRDAVFAQDQRLQRVLQSAERVVVYVRYAERKFSTNSLKRAIKKEGK